jgi:hydrogenase expression/formation protein HypC
MKIIRIKDQGKSAIADMNGAKREISTMLLGEDVSVGDWVTVHIGFAIEKIDIETAEEIIYVLSRVG